MVLASIVGLTMFQGSPPSPRFPTDVGPTPGQMYIVAPDKENVPMPLKHTSVDAQIAGFGARVTVKQSFSNPSKSPIEAIYTFPLPNDAAVDKMTMKIGNRIIAGEIKPREVARRIYEAAKNAGQTASLLDQERPNIFTQSVANVMPGQAIDIEISYVQVLKYDKGEFEFSFPMVVGPRFTDAKTPDPDKVSPPITPKGTRSGQTISLDVSLDAGAPLQEVQSVLHQVQVKRPGTGKAQISLVNKEEIPNRDFILRYRVATDSVQSALLTNYDADKGGFFSLILLPPKAPTVAQIRPREIIFVMDQSGSQSGFPIQKSKELTLKMIKLLRPTDTFNVIGFNNTVNSLWDAPRPATPTTIAEANDFVSKLDANGGTQLREGVVAALNAQRDTRRLRIVLFNTDGFIGDEKLVLDAIRQNRQRARMFTFGIGNGVNRYLIDSMSEEGKGAAEYVTLAESADRAVNRFTKRLQTPVLTDVSATFTGVPVQDILPSQIPDVFDESPVVLYGRYKTPGKGTLTLHGTLGGQPWSKDVVLDLPATASASAVPTLWARRKVDDLERMAAISPALGEQFHMGPTAVRDLALEFGIMSAETSFVAVEKKVVNVGGKARTIRVPVEMTDGVSYEGIFGGQLSFDRRPQASGPMGGGMGGYGGGGFGGGGLYRGAASSSLSAAAPAGRAKSEALDDQGRSFTPEELYEVKVAKKLRQAKGKVEVQIMVSSTKPEDIAALKKAGLTVELIDKDVKVVFGKIDVKKLQELSTMGFVQFVEPIE